MALLENKTAVVTGANSASDWPPLSGSSPKVPNGSSSPAEGKRN
jgi:hypothetical protein